MIYCQIVLRWMSLDLTDDMSTLVQVMAWCCQVTSHYLSQCCPDPCRHMTSLGQELNLCWIVLINCLSITPVYTWDPNLVITVPADTLAPGNARPWAGTVIMTFKLELSSSKFLWLLIKSYDFCGQDEVIQNGQRDLMKPHGTWSVNSSPPGKKWLPFHRRYFEMHFLNEKFSILIKISMKFVQLTTTQHLV